MTVNCFTNSLPQGKESEREISAINWVRVCECEMRAPFADIMGLA